MADNSLESLVEWMKTGDPLRGWGMIFALGRDAANRLLWHEHVLRFGSGAHIPVVSGDIPGFGDTLNHRISHVVLGAPRLSFAPSRLSTAKVGVALPILGGSHLTWEKKPFASWLMTRMAFYDPLQGPSLTLELPLAEEPATVADDPRMYLDLSSGANYRLGCADSDVAQALGGAFFEVLFKGLNSAQVEYPIGRLHEPDEHPLRPVCFKLAAQAAEAGVGTDDGALFALIQVVAGTSAGSTPGVDDYHYLIPDDEAGEYTSTVLFHRAFGAVQPGEVLLDSLFKLLGVDESGFDIQRTNGELIKATATGGALSIAQNATRLLPLKVDGQWVQAVAYTPAVDIPTTGATPLTLERQADGKYSLNWVSPEQTATSIIKFDHTWPDQQKQVPYKIELRAVFGQVETEDGSLELQASTFTAKGPPLPNIPLHERGRPGGVEALAPYVMLSLVHYGTVRAVAAVRSGLSLKPKLDSRGAYDHWLVDALVGAVVELNGDSVFRTDVKAVPLDIACVGRIRPSATGFSISPPQLRMLAGATCTFTASPAMAGLSWAAANAAPGGGPAGLINASSGEYQAPDAANMTGQYTWIRISATAGGVTRHTLVSVVVEALTVSPVFAQCSHDSEPTLLRAGQVTPGQLQWAIRNPDPAFAGSLQDNQDGTCTYRPHPLLTGSYFVVDEVVVTDTLTHAEQSAVMLVEHTPRLEIQVNRVQAGAVQLSATLNGISIYAPQWTIELGGPGVIGNHGDGGEAGRYVADADAPDRFVLLKVKSTRTAELPEHIHYVALPLPLSDFVPNQPAQVTP